MIQCYFGENKLVSPYLRALALQAPTNSVPTERAFSMMNLIHTKLCNRLTSERVNKLQYIHFTQPTLDQMITPELTTKELPAVEEQWMGEQQSTLGKRRAGEEEDEDENEKVDDISESYLSLQEGPALGIRIFI